MSFATELKSALTRIADGINRKAEREGVDIRVTVGEVSDWFFGAKSASTKHDAGTLEILGDLASLSGKKTVAKSKYKSPYPEDDDS